MQNFSIESTGRRTQVVNGKYKPVVWALLWALSVVLIAKAVLCQWLTSPPMSMIALALNTAIGVGVIFILVQFLSGSDDPQHKIQMVSLAVALVVGLGGVVTDSFMVTVEFIADAEMSDIVMVMLRYLYGRSLN